MPSIRFENVTKTFPPDLTVLEGITMNIEQGEFVSIVGASGAGKSTLLKLIYAEEVPTEGQVFFGDRDVHAIRRKHLPFYRRNIGTVFQDFKLFPQKSVYENVAYALEVVGRTDAEIKEEVPQILEIVGLLPQVDKYPRQLSGGEQQRVSLARALVHGPSVIIADEPTGNLDPNSTQDIVKLLLEINGLNTTVILATHNKAVVDKINRRVITLEKGKIIRDEIKGKYVI